MSREIKFRVWDNYDKLMYCNVVVGENLIIFNYKVEESFDSDDELDLDYDIDLHTYVYLTDENRKYFNIMQYTGLKDKNRKEIYEGDIVRYFKDELGIVKFVAGSFIIDGNTCYESFLELGGEIEIVGNIYEDKNLLED